MRRTAARPRPRLATVIAERDRLHALINGHADIIWEVDAQCRHTYVSSQVETLLGYTPAQMVGRTLFDFMPPEEAARISVLAAEVMLRKQPLVGMISCCQRSDGRLLTVETNGLPLLDAQGQVVGYRGVTRDVTEREEQAARIAWLARHDGLTGLANRMELHARVEERLGRQQPLGLLMLDLDFFKDVNDRLGHTSGDALLRLVAQRLRQHVPAGSHAARLGGDEFAVLLAVEDAAQAEAQARRLAQALCEPYPLEGRRVVVGASAGLALAPRHAVGVAGLMHCADLALLNAKQEGRGEFRVYGPGLEARQRTDEAMEAALRQAIAQEQVALLYHPVRALAGGQVQGCLALPRWRHPRQGEIPAESFLALAERSGLVLPLGAQWLRRACAAAGRWPEAWRVTVPVTAVQLRDPGFPDLVAQILAETRLSPARLEVAVCEAALGATFGAHMSPPLGTAPPAAPGSAPGNVPGNAPRGGMPRALRKLRELGVSLALYQFGEEGMALAHLARFAFGRLWLSASLVERLPEEPAAGLVAAAALLARRLGMEVVAAGVERPAQLEALREAGCAAVLGPLAGASLPEEALPAALMAETAALPP
nr:EAL domain-containing protein [Roseomonas sp. GC11]